MNYLLWNDVGPSIIMMTHEEKVLIVFKKTEFRRAEDIARKADQGDSLFASFSADLE